MPSLAASPSAAQLVVVFCVVLVLLFLFVPDPGNMLTDTSSKLLSFAAVAAAGSAAAQAPVDLSWHAPAQTELNDLTKVIEGTGVYGYIYNSSQTPADKYGIYNWCNMPHVRKTEYVEPSKEYRLKYVEVVSWTL